MSGDATEPDWGNLDFTDHTDRSFITDISDTLGYLSGENRAQRRKQKLREELVHEHIENTKQAPSPLQSLVNKLIKLP